MKDGTQHVFFHFLLPETEDRRTTCVCWSLLVLACTCVGVTLCFLRLKHSEQTCCEEAKLSLAGVGQCGDHLSHRCFSTHA